MWVLLCNQICGFCCVIGYVEIIPFFPNVFFLEMTESPPTKVGGFGKSRLKSKPNKVRLKIKSFNKDASQLNS